MSTTAPADPTAITARELQRGDVIVKNDGRCFEVASVSGPADPLTTVVALIPVEGGAVQRVGLLPESRVMIVPRVVDPTYTAGQAVTVNEPGQPPVAATYVRPYKCAAGDHVVAYPSGPVAVPAAWITTAEAAR